MEDDEGIGGVIEAIVEVDDCGVEEGGKEGEKALEVGEEGRVVESPWTGLVGVPEGEREGVSEGEPVAVDLEVGAAVGGDEEELDGGGDEEEPGEVGNGVGRVCDLVFWGLWVCHGLAAG